MRGLIAALLFFLPTAQAAAVPDGDYVVLLHGVARTSSTMNKIEKKLTAEGFQVLNVDYESRAYTLEVLAGKIHESIYKFRIDKKKKLHFVGYSMGGLLTRAYIKKHKPENLGRVVFLGTPHHGSEVADFLKDFSVYQAIYGPAGQQLTTDQNFDKLFGKADYEAGVVAGIQSMDPISSLLIIPGKSDGKVSVESTHVTGEKDHIEIKTTHTFMPQNKDVIRQTVHFLKHGVFSRPDTSHPK